MKKNTRPGTQTAKFEPNRKVNPVGIIDSLNISDRSLLSILNQNEDYIIEPVKIGKDANEKRWIQEFGRPLYHQTKTGRWGPLEVYIVHCTRAVSLPLKVFKHRLGITEVLEFAGMQKYTEEGQQRKLTLSDMWDKIQCCQISRIDIAIDLVNQQQLDEVCKALKHVDRHAEVYKNTTYHKTPKQGKKRSVVNILHYDKGEKENWEKTKKITRVEFQFRSEFFTKMQVKDFDKAIKKMENRILRDTGIRIKILPISSKLIPKEDDKSNDGVSKSVWKQLTTYADSMLELLKKEIQKITCSLNQIKDILTQIQTDINLVKVERRIERKKSCIQSSFFKTDEMATDISTSTSFLEKNMGKIFTEGKHYGRPCDARLLRWDVEQMHKWLMGKDTDETDKQLLSKLLD